MTVAIPAQETCTTLSSSVTLTDVSLAQAARCARTLEAWTSDDVYAYTLEELLRVHGPQLPSLGTDEHFRKIMDEFCERFGIPAAARIVRAVFEVYNGMWQGAPLTILRFTPGHDSFFSDQILAAHGG